MVVVLESKTIPGIYSFIYAGFVIVIGIYRFL